MRAVAEEPHDAVVKFDRYRNVQRHRAVLPAIVRHLVLFNMVNLYFCCCGVLQDMQSC